VAVLSLSRVPAALAHTVPDRVLHSFVRDGFDGGWPSSRLLPDGLGGFYGATSAGGKLSCDNGCGTIYHLIPRPKGGYVERVVHRFQWSNPGDGSYPRGDLVADAAGALFGTTDFGGSVELARRFCPAGCGTVFELTPHAGGFRETVLYSFTGGIDGIEPGNGVVLDAHGNLFGTAPYGGASGSGVAFELIPSGKT